MSLTTEAGGSHEETLSNIQAFTCLIKRPLDPDFDLSCAQLAKNEKK